MFQGFLYGLLLLFRTSGLSAIFRLRFVIILPFNNPVLSFHLCDIKVCHMEPVLLLHPLLDLLIGCLAFRRLSHIHQSYLRNLTARLKKEMRTNLHRSGIFCILTSYAIANNNTGGNHL